MRHCELQVTYEGQDITRDILPFLQSFQYDEVATGEADSTELTLTDTDLRWMNSWQPIPGDMISAVLTSYDWHFPGEELTLNVPNLQVDSPEFHGPPDTITIKGLNVDAGQGYSDLPRDTCWSLITLKELGAEIAARYNMTFDYQVDQDFVIHSLKRTKQSDAACLDATCAKYNCCLKSYANKLVIFSMATLEQQDPVITLTKGSSNIESYTLNSPLVGIYDGVTIKYKPTRSKQMLEATWPPGATGKIMVIQQACDDIQQAELMAKARLRESRIKAHTATFDLSLDLRVVAGCTVQLEGFGQFSGLYFVDKASHRYGGSAATTTIDCHMCLQPAGSY